MVELVCEPGLVPELGVGIPLEVKLLRPVEMLEAPSSSPLPNVKLNKYSITSTLMRLATALVLMYVSMFVAS